MKITALAKKIASRLAKEFSDAFVQVDWKFTQNTFDSYDPFSDTSTSRFLVKSVKILAYPVESSDSNSNYSSTGVFIDSPQDLEKCQILIVWDQLPDGISPTNKDTFIWNNNEFNVRNVQMYPTQAVYVLEAWR